MSGIHMTEPNKPKQIQKTLLWARNEGNRFFIEMRLGMHKDEKDEGDE